MADYSAGRMGVDTFVNFDHERPLLNIILFSGFWYLTYQTARCHGYRHRRMRSVPLRSHMLFVFMGICQTFFISVDFPRVVSEAKTFQLKQIYVTSKAHSSIDDFYYSFYV